MLSNTEKALQDLVKAQQETNRAIRDFIKVVERLGERIQHHVVYQDVEYTARPEKDPKGIVE